MSKQLYSYLQLVQSLLAPGIAAVFMAGIFSRRVTPEVRPRRPRHRIRARHAAAAAAGACTRVAGVEVARADPGLRRHQLAVLQLPAVRVHLRGDIRGQPVHAQGLDRTDRRAHLQVGVRAAECRGPRRPTASGRSSTPAWSSGSSSPSTSISGNRARRASAAWRDNNQPAFLAVRHVTRVRT